MGWQARRGLAVTALGESRETAGEAGKLRCTDLAEWWGIDGYEDEPDPFEMLTRQKRIWEENGLDNYYLLVAAKNRGATSGSPKSR